MLECLSILKEIPMAKYESILGAIGNTPVVRIN